MALLILRWAIAFSDLDSGLRLYRDYQTAHNYGFNNVQIIYEFNS